MVSLTKEQQKQYVKELSEAIETIRIKYGCKPCEHGESEGVALFTFYKKGWSHSTLMGDFDPDHLLEAMMNAIQQNEKEREPKIAI